jgi:hypothetical protein
MPRVITQRKNRAGKERSCGKCGDVIQPGEEYKKWSFRYGGTRYRCMKPGCSPRPSDLTQSKMAEVYAAIEGAEDELPGTDFDGIEDLVHGVAETVSEIAEEYREAAEPFGGEGENAERADELEGFADELQSFAPDDPEEEEPTQEETVDARSAAEEVLGGCPL